MIIGVPKEIKAEENRVAVVPGGVETLAARGHTVIIERGSGTGSGFSDLDYERAGARIAASYEQVFLESDLILKVKEPLPSEYPLLERGTGPLHLSSPRGF